MYIFRTKTAYSFLFFGISLLSCTSKVDQYFALHEGQLDFNNELTYSNELNPYTYRNYYNGAGVGVGDFDNDGLDDIYFAGNQVDNKLYRNLGDLKFEEVTSSLLSCAGSWSTGISVVDINADGLMDIYVCKAGPPEGPRRKNELFVNQGNWKFEEKSADYGLDIKGFSVHASFFDFDNDGDLDCYLLNNSIRPVGGYDLRSGLRDVYSNNGNMLLINENGFYTNKSKELGIYTSDIGFGLGVNTSDINGDGWKDIYVGNDFFEKDYLYINQEGKGFVECGQEYFGSYSMGSMGVDVADINNDGLKDIFVAEMAPASIPRKKTKATYESWDKSQRAIRSGYHYQFGRNMLHINQGQFFTDLSREKKMDATEWSWAPLIFDMNNDGLKDLFVSNGIGKDLLDRDYLAYMANEQRVSELLQNKNEEALKKLIDIMPSQKTMNAFFIQQESFNFSNIAGRLIDLPLSFSSGTALSDFDGDGDYDMVISNINDEAFLLENKSTSNFLSIKLTTSDPSIPIIGTELIVYSPNRTQHFDNNPYRGFQSTNSQTIIVGLSDELKVDSIEVIWPDNRIQVEKEIQSNKSVTISKREILPSKRMPQKSSKLQIIALDSVVYNYPVRQFNEFNKEKLLTSMLPSTNPLIIPLNGSPSVQQDFIFGGGQNVHVQKGILDKNGWRNKDSFSLMKSYRPHVTDFLPFDSDNDGDLDLYAAHGSRVFSQYSSELDDIIYQKDDSGEYTPLVNAIRFDHKMITSCVASADVNNDGLQDIFVAERVRDEVYGKSTRLFCFKNEGGNKFEQLAILDHPRTGLITDIEIVDVDADGKDEIIIAGEWMGIDIYQLTDNEFVFLNDKFDLRANNGMWRDIEVVDIDKDGDLDIIGANQGVNTFLTEKSKIYIADFDENGKAEQIHTYQLEMEDYPILDYDDITNQLPNLRAVAKNYSEYSKTSISELFEKDVLQKALIREIQELRTGVFLNNSGSFTFSPFPKEVQYSSMHVIEIDDINDDGISDIIIGGNHFLYKPQFGRDDASRGLVLIGNLMNDKYLISDIQSLNISGEIRAIENCGNNEYLIGVNGKDIIRYKVEYED